MPFPILKNLTTMNMMTQFKYAFLLATLLMAAMPSERAMAADGANVFWENSASGEAVNWTVTYRFGLEGSYTDQCLAVFPQTVWDKIKTTTFFLDVAATYPQIRVATGWWDPVWTGDDIYPGNELLTDNGDGTFTLTLNFSDAPDFVSLLDERNLLFTGSGYTPLALYFEDSGGEEVGGETSGRCGAELYWTYEESTQTLTIRGTGKMADYTSSGAPWYGHRSKIKTVVIKDGATSIGNYAFLGCRALTSVTIPSGVTSIGSNAFRECTNLPSLTIPSSVTSIERFAFWACKGLTSVHISDLAAWFAINFASAESNPLYSAHHLYLGEHEIVDLTIPASVTTIRDYALAGCSGLTSLTIPNSVTAIGIQAFQGCSGLASVSIANSVAAIGNQAFQDCSGLTAVTLPNSVITIGNQAFQGCSSLASATLPNSITDISESLFQDCSSLTAVTIPGRVTRISAYAFSGCSSLASVTIPDGVTVIGAYAFRECSSLASVAIPRSATSILSGVFYNCTSLASVTIPDGVTSISESLFYGCSRLSSVTIPASVTTILNRSFLNCSSLASIIIPASVTTIRDYALAGCSGLATLTIPDGVMSIGDYTFFSCSSLTSIVIPGSVTSIGTGAFASCGSLKEVRSMISEPYAIDEHTFAIGTYYPPTATLYVPVGTKSLYEATVGWNIFPKIVEMTPVTEPSEGDVNGDGTVGIGDIVAITNVMAGIETNPDVIARANVNGDASVGIGDIVAITNIMAGIAP